MSLINDALKQARQAQSQNPPGGTPPLPPVETKSQGGPSWTLITAVILFVAAILIFVISSNSKQKSVPAPMTNAPAPMEAQVKPAPTNLPEAPATNVPATVAGQFPKVQGIIYDATHPVAIVDRKTVRIGDSDGDFKVAAISRTSVTFQRVDGSLQEIKLGEQ